MFGILKKKKKKKGIAKSSMAVESKIKQKKNQEQDKYIICCYLAVQKKEGTNSSNHSSRPPMLDGTPERRERREAEIKEKQGRGYHFCVVGERLPPPELGLGFNAAPYNRGEPPRNGLQP